MAGDPQPSPATLPGVGGIPHRPVLRRDVVLLRRADDVLQVGDACRRGGGVLLPGVQESALAWAQGLDGSRTCQEALADAAAAGLGEEHAQALLAALAAAGALVGTTEMPAPLRLATPQERRRWEPDLAAAALTHGSVSAGASAFDRRAAAWVAVHGHGRVAAAVRSALAAAAIPAGSGAVGTGTGTAPDLVLLAGPAHPDVPDDGEALRSDLPHLPVGVAGRRAVIGPLVVPGLTGCLRCTHLHRTDRDPAWPRVALQLAHRSDPVPPVDGVLALAAAAVAVLQACAWLEAGGPEARRAGRLPPDWQQEPPPTLHAAVELTLPGGLTRSLPRPAHPLCGCLWR